MCNLFQTTSAVIGDSGALTRLVRPLVEAETGPGPGNVTARLHPDPEVLVPDQERTSALAPEIPSAVWTLLNSYLKPGNAHLNCN